MKGRQRGCYPVTADVEKKMAHHISKIKTGTIHLFLVHTDCGLSLNDVSDLEFRKQMALFHKKLVPYDDQMLHKYAGEDDLPGHALTNMVGVEVTLNINDGKLVLGKWQGVFLNEFRNFGGDRKIMATVMGQLY